MTRSTASRGTRTAAARSWWCNLASEVVAELRPRIQEIEKLGDNARRYRVIETFGQLLKGGTGILLQAVEPGGMTMTVTTSRDSARANEQLVVEAELKPDNKTTSKTLRMVRKNLRVSRSCGRVDAWGLTS